MKIVYATDNYWPRVSGMAVSVDTFRHELEALGHEVHVLAPEYPGAEAADLAHHRTHVHRFRSWGLFFSSEDRLVRHSERGAVADLLDDLEPDVVHVQTELLMGRAAWRWAQAHDVPLVITAHTHWERYINNYFPFPPVFGRALARSIMRRVLSGADVVVTPSAHMKQVLQDYGVARPIAVIPTGFEAHEFEGLDRAAEHRDSYFFATHPELKDRTVLLTVGRVAQEKNLDFLLEVVARLVPRLPRLTWLVVGDGPSLAGLRRAVTQRGLDGHVVMTGYVDRTRVKHAFALADVFALASRTETQGLATVEALGSGLPVVAVDEMGSSDVLAGEEGGFLVPHDVDAFAERVLQLVQDPELYQRKAQETKVASARWAPRALAQQMLDLYGQVVVPGALGAPVPVGVA